MNILAIDDKQSSLDLLIAELKIVFPNSEPYGEKEPEKVLQWAAALKEKGEELTYAFLAVKTEPMSGLELARRLKMLHPKIRLFFCTAYSEYALDAFKLFAKGYLLKPITAEKIKKALDEMIDNWQEELENNQKNIKVRTFGNFEVFSNGVPVSFEREKAKELFAYLVDRHGSSVTTRQIFNVLWEDEPYDQKSKNRATATITALKSSLKAVNIDDVLIKTWNHLAIDVSKIKCDAYDYENGDATAVNSFHGEYMANYSWAEFTTGRLFQAELKRY